MLCCGEGKDKDARSYTSSLFAIRWAPWSHHYSTINREQYCKFSDSGYLNCESRSWYSVEVSVL